jgi:hypothetical protein
MHGINFREASILAKRAANARESKNNKIIHVGRKDMIAPCRRKRNHCG